jgi:molybdopterin-guanine dinucleotide biosynthesis protein A
MGKNKALLELRGQTMLKQIRAVARGAGLPVRTISRDIGPRRGPLGGVVTALAGSRKKRVVFLACDMPFVTSRLLQKMLERFSPEDGSLKDKLAGRALFTCWNDKPSFPFILSKSLLPVVQEQIKIGRLSIRELSRVLAAQLFIPSKVEAKQLFNINTPREWQAAIKLWDRRAQS